MHGMNTKPTKPTNYSAKRKWEEFAADSLTDAKIFAKGNKLRAFFLDMAAIALTKANKAKL
jgi:hypothetical protein